MGVKIVGGLIGVAHSQDRQMFPIGMNGYDDNGVLTDYELPPEPPWWFNGRLIEPVR